MDFALLGPLLVRRDQTIVPVPTGKQRVLLAALLLALLAIAHLAVTDRSWMLYYDSETVLPALVRGSVLAGQPQDWALSAVLFIPEMGLYFALAALGLGMDRHEGWRPWRSYAVQYLWSTLDHAINHLPGA